jgi:hypothetical protein
MGIFGLRREAERHAAFARTERLVYSSVIIRVKAPSPLPLCRRSPKRGSRGRSPHQFFIRVHPCSSVVKMILR